MLKGTMEIIMGLQIYEEVRVAIVERIRIEAAGIRIQIIRNVNWEGMAKNDDFFCMYPKMDERKIIPFQCQSSFVFDIDSIIWKILLFILFLW